MNFKAEHRYNPKNSRHYLNNCSTVLHCHHYVSLITQLALYTDQFSGEIILKDTAEDVFYSVLRDYFEANLVQSPEDKVEVARDYYRYIGMGLIDFTVTATNIQAKMEYSHVDGARM